MFSIVALLLTMSFAVTRVTADLALLDPIECIRPSRGLDVVEDVWLLPIVLVRQHDQPLDHRAVQAAAKHHHDVETDRERQRP